MFKIILVATDGSEHALKAVDLAADLAQKYDAQIVLLHVLLRDAAVSDLHNLADVGSLPQAVQDELNVMEGAAPVATPMGGVYIPSVPRSVLEGVGSQILDKAKAAMEGKGVKIVSASIDDGDPAEKIVASAERENADTIIMGNRGVSDLAGLFLGSVSHKVSHRCDCTCITVK